MKPQNKLRAKFLKIYADLPVAIRRQTVAVIDDEPYTWNPIYIEVENKTKLGDRMLKYLNDLGII